MTKLLLDVKDLKTYFFLKRGTIKAVDGVSFSLSHGESIGLVGESGGGKTITAMSLLRLEPKPAAKIVGGKILFDGVDLALKNEKEMRKIRGGKISMIMQDPMTSLNPAYTIGDQISEVIKLHGKTNTKQEVKDRTVESLEAVRIPAAASRINDYPHQLSGGMRQRVVGAIAISCSPLLLIADEPTTALDVTTQSQYLRLLKHIQNETGVALIFITHDLGIVARMCEKICVMYLGKVLERGKVRDLWDNARHPYTIALMNSVPRLESKRKRLYSIKGMVPSLLERPSGCTFHSRCEKAIEKCKRQYPREEKVNGEHYVSCFRAWE